MPHLRDERFTSCEPRSAARHRRDLTGVGGPTQQVCYRTLAAEDALNFRGEPRLTSAYRSLDDCEQQYLVAGKFDAVCLNRKDFLLQIKHSFSSLNHFGVFRNRKVVGIGWSDREHYAIRVTH